MLLMWKTFALSPSRFVFAVHLPRYQKTVCNYYSSDSSENKEAPITIPHNILKIHDAVNQSQNGKIYDKKPFKMRCEPGKYYMWCLCGHSRSQPLCDGTHKAQYLKLNIRPIKFEVAEDKEYWLCNCKQTSNRPFCDGTHKRKDIQEAVK